MKISTKLSAYGVALFAALLLLIGNVGAAHATTIHVSTETYFSTGGTSVTGCTGVGCPSADFTVGNVSGTDVWSVTEKVTQDTTAGTTDFSWTIFNDGMQATPITSFHMFANGLLADSNTAQNGWTFSQDSNGFAWSTSTASSGVTFGSENVHAIFNTLNLTVVFAPNTGFDTIAGGLTSNAGWVVSSPSTVPEPGSLVLLGSGLVAMWSMRRRIGKRLSG